MKTKVESTDDIFDIEFFKWDRVNDLVCWQVINKSFEFGKQPFVTS